MKRARTIPQRRQDTHGLFGDSALISQALKVVIARGPRWSKLSSRHREALQMIAFKMARIVCGDPDHVDHWDDIAGYAQLGRAACRKGRR